MGMDNKNCRIYRLFIRKVIFSSIKMDVEVPETAFIILYVTSIGCSVACHKLAQSNQVSRCANHWTRSGRRFHWLMTSIFDPRASPNSKYRSLIAPVGSSTEDQLVLPSGCPPFLPRVTNTVANQCLYIGSNKARSVVCYRKL